MKRCTLFFLLILFTATSGQAEMVSIAGERVNMRSGPGTKYSVLWELGSGFPLKKIKLQGNWMKVQDFEGDTGWVFKKFTDKTPTVIVSKKLINIRSGPSTKSSIVGSAEYGTVLKLIGKNKGWVKIQHRSNLIGWIKRNLLWGW